MISTGNMVNRELIALFAVNFPAIRELFEAGNKVIEVNNEAVTVHE